MPVVYYNQDSCNNNHNKSSTFNGVENVISMSILKYNLFNL